MAVAQSNIIYLMIPLIMAKRRTKGLVMDTKLFLKALLQTSAITAVAVGSAFAQDNDSDSTEANEVVVTGSRIKSDTFSSPVAIDVLTVEDAKIEGIADLGGLLQTSTAASGSSQITSAVSADSPDLNVLSFVFPVRRFLYLTLITAWPLPGL